MSEQPQARKYQVAFSFADENRDYVRRVAKVLRAAGISVFAYTDKEVSAELLGKPLNAYLQGVFRDHADFAVLFISKTYTERDWTKEEVKYAQERALRSKSEYIISARFDDSEIPGLTTIDAFADLRKMKPEAFAELLIQKLRPIPKVTPEPGPRIPRTTLIRWAVACAIVLILSVLVTAWWLSRLPPSVAVVAIENQSGRPDWVGVAISELVASNFAAGSAVRVTPQDDVARMKMDLQLGGGTNPSKEMLQSIRKRLSVRWVIVGSYQYKSRDAPDSTLVEQLQLRMLDTANGKELAATTPSTGSDAQLGKLVSLAAVDLRERAGLQQLSIAQTAQADAALPKFTSALRLYSEGLTRLRRHDAQGARDFLIAALRAENHSLVHSVLAEAYLAFGADPLAAAEARKALIVYGNLPKEQKSKEQMLQIAARAYELARPPNWQKVVELRRALWAGPPRKLEHGLRLADAQISQGEVEGALLTIAELRKLAYRDPRVDLVEARTYQQQSKFDRQKELARDAADHAEAVGATSLVAEARLIEATAHYKRNDPQAMSAAIEDAHAKFLVTRDDYGEARALEQEATRLDRIVEYELERRYLDRALAIHRKRGDRFAIARVLLNKGTAFHSQGRTGEALPLYKEALTTFETIDAPYPHAVTLNQLGAAMFDLGDLQGAQASYEQALGLFDRSSDLAGRATAITNVGEVYECLGNLAKAIEKHEESLRMNEALKDREGIAYDLFRLGEVFELKGDFAAARARYDDARTTYQANNTPAGVADCYVALAALDIDEGKPAAAQKSLREAEAIFAKGEVTDRLARILAVTAESLLAQRKQKEALSMAEKALSGTPAANLRLRLPIETTLARIRAASEKQEDRDAALLSLQKTIAEARTGLFVVCELDARLAAAEIEEQFNLPGAGQKLAALEEEAKQKGFGRIAKLASR